MVDTGAAAVAEAEASMAEVVIMEGIPEDVEVDILVDSMAGILVVDTVLLLHLEDILLGTMVVTTEDTEGGLWWVSWGLLWWLSRWNYSRGFPVWGFGLGWGLWGWPLLGWAYSGWPYYSYGGYPYLGWPYYSSAYPSGVGMPYQESTPAYSQPEQQQPSYWYYCQNPQGYYPYVKSCPGGWITVVPNVTPPNQ